jgi:hypothetical protein
MLLIKESSVGMDVHFNLIGKVNVMFAWFVINFLSMLILFDSFLNHHLLLAPKPYRNSSLSVEHQSMLVHNNNKEILIQFCKNQGGSRVDKYFADVSKQGCVDIKQIWSTSTKFIRQYNAGIVSSFASYKQTYTGEKKRQELWIYHYVILQMFHPFFCLYPDKKFEGTFCDDNHRHFLHKISKRDKLVYNEIHGEDPNFY